MDWEEGEGRSGVVARAGVVMRANETAAAVALLRQERNDAWESGGECSRRCSIRVVVRIVVLGFLLCWLEGCLIVCCVMLFLDVV